MISAFSPVPLTTDFAGAHYRPQLAVYSRVIAVDRPFPHREVGTGGLASELFVRSSMGYQPFKVLEFISPVDQTPFASLMQEVKTGFGRTLSRLPEVFGVSRQTLYNWLDGETPKSVHQEKLKQLAQAGNVFTELGFKLTPLMLDRTIAQGKTFIQLMADGADGKNTAKKLVGIVQRGTESRAKLDQLLGGRKAKLTAEDIGAPLLDESV